MKGKTCDKLFIAAQSMSLDFSSTRQSKGPFVAQTSVKKPHHGLVSGEQERSVVYMELRLENTM
jgi:hypothetical protein